MGLLDTLVNTATAAMSQGQGASPGQGGNAIEILQGLVQQHGGLGGLLDTLRQQGLGSHVDSWIGTGRNMPVNAQQIIDALGQGPLAQIAQRFGIDPQQAASHIAEILPKAVDHLSPNGQLPSGDLVSSALQMLKGRL